MQRSKDWSVWLLVVSGVLIAIFLNLSTFKWAFSIINSDGLNSLDERGMQRLIFGGIVTLVHLVLFLLLGLFHYRWKDGLLRLPWPKALTITVILLITVVIYGGLGLLENYLFRNNFIVLIKRVQPEYFIWNNLPVGVIAIAEAYFLILWRKVKASELEKIQLQEEKANAELAALKEQISPHFFFNTLSSLSTIVRNEKKEVGLEFIQALSNTYRYTLASKRQELVTVKEELEFVKSYLFVLSKRFGDKIICEMNISEESLQMKVPPMSVQLLVENATQHNVITKATPLTIKIFLEDNMLSVENTLQEKVESEGLGLGLQNLTSRYRLIARKDIVILKDKYTFKVKLPLL